MRGAVLAVACAAAACAKAGAPAQLVMPAPVATPDPIQCDAAAHYAEPLIVDLDGSQRAEIEQAMARGVVVVSYDCKHLRLLPDCHIDGTYGYQGMSLKESVIRIDNSDDLHANLPSFVPSAAARIEAGFARGQVLDVAIALVGARRTTWVRANPGDLLGDAQVCAGATHFVRGALVGAFTRAAGERGHVSTAADVFGAKLSAASEASQTATDSDGRLDDCHAASPDSDTPPKQCRSPIRLQLTALDSAELAKAARTGAAVEDAKALIATAAVPQPACPRGFALTGGALCKRASADAAHACDPGNTSDCRAQCDKGDLASCVSLGIALSGQNDPAAALVAFGKACDAGLPNGCLGAGYARWFGQNNLVGAFPLLRKACDGGSAEGCFLAGKFEARGQGTSVDDKAALRDLTKSCGGGHKDACVTLGIQYEHGSGVPRDGARATALYKEACDGGSPTGCAWFGLALDLGTDIAPDPNAATRLLTKAKAIGSPWGELYLAMRQETGVTAADGAVIVAQDDGGAHAAYAHVFESAGDEEEAELYAAAILNALYGEKRPLGAPIMEAAFKRATARALDPKLVCDSDPRACAFAGVLLVAKKDKAHAARLLQKACDSRDRWACFEIKRFKLP